jgi:hypothetical protein
MNVSPPKVVSDDDDTVVVIIIIIIVFVVIAAVYYYIRRGGGGGDGIYGNFNKRQTAAAACDVKKKVYRILGAGVPPCANGGCPLDDHPIQISPAPLRCKTGKVMFTNNDGVKCCKFPDGTPTSQQEEEHVNIFQSKADSALGGLGLPHGDVSDTIAAVCGIEFVKFLTLHGGMRKFIDFGLDKSGRTTLAQYGKKILYGHSVEDGVFESANSRSIKATEEGGLRAVEHGGGKSLEEGAIHISEHVGERAVGRRLGGALAKKTTEKLAGRLVKKMAEKVALKVVGRTAVKVGVMFATGEAAVGSSCVAEEVGGCAAGPIGCALGGVACGLTQVAAFVVMGLQILGEVTDVAGTRQYIDNEKTVKAMRDQIEGAIAVRGYGPPEGVNDQHHHPPPYLFNLGLIQHMPNHSETDNDFYIIPDAHADAHANSLINHLPDAMMKYFESLREDNDPNCEHIARQFVHALTTGDFSEVDFPDGFYEAIDTNINQKFKERDDHIWEFFKKNYPKLQINGNNGKYVMYRPEISSVINHGISLNRAGVDYYNRMLRKTTQSADTIHPVIFSKYYRDITGLQAGSSGTKTLPPGTTAQNYHYTVVQKALPTEFPQINMAYNYVKSICENGFDTETLKSLYPLDKYTHMNAVRPQIKPQQHYVTYDEDTGLCKFDTTNSNWSNVGYCRYMGYSPDPVIKEMPCEGGGCQKKTYPTCEKPDGLFDDFVDFTGFSGMVVIFDRGIGEIEKFVGAGNDSIIHKIGHALHVIVHPSEWFD